MSAGVETANGMQDAVKWFVAIALLVAGVAGFYYFSDQSQLLRVVGILVLSGAAVAVALQTERGRTAWGFVREARTEVRKVVWPTRKETVQTTLIVMGMVMVVALILWGLDGLLGYAMSHLLGTGA